jgi:transcriptional regulatory protein LevR
LKALNGQASSNLGQFISYKIVKDVRTNKSIERPVLTKIKREYKDDQAKFDDILSAIGDYFDLFKTNTQRLE